jgi:hypothetical protein
MVSFMPQLLYPQGKVFGSHSIRGWVGSWIWFLSLSSEKEASDFVSLWHWFSFWCRSTVCLFVECKKSPYPFIWLAIHINIMNITYKHFKSCMVISPMCCWWCSGINDCRKWTVCHRQANKSVSVANDPLACVLAKWQIQVYIESRYA